MTSLILDYIFSIVIAFCASKKAFGSVAVVFAQSATVSMLLNVDAVVAP